MKITNPLLVFDEERALKVFRHVIKSWRERRSGFQLIETIEINLPSGVSGGSREHALILFFFGWLNRYGEKAVVLRDYLPSIWESYLEIIDPQKLAMDGLQKVLTRVIPLADAEPNRINHWLRCRQILLERYNGDPRNIFLDHGLDRESLIGALDVFPGIGRKIAQLIGIWFQAIWWPGNLEARAKWRQIRRIPMMPVDMWIDRLLVQTRVVAECHFDRRNQIVNEISEFTCDLCARHHLAHVDLAQGLWHVGAMICSKRPKGRKQEKQAEIFCLSHCPLHDLCLDVIPGAAQLYLGGQIGVRARTKRCSGQNLFAPR